MRTHALVAVATAFVLCTILLGSGVGRAQTWPDSDPTDCQYYHAPTQSTFDLTPLMVPPYSWYRVSDHFRTSERNYTYYFNFCAAATAGQQSAACPVVNQSIAWAAAFQVRNTDGRCYKLNYNYSDSFWQLNNVSDPTRGVQITYQHGDSCGGGINRELHVIINCAEHYSNTPLSSVREVSKCHYEVMLNSSVGCPLECPLVRTTSPNGQSESLVTCGLHGVCGFDTDLGAPRCFCDANHSGKDCTQPAESGSSAKCDSFCAAMAVLIVLLSILLIVAGVIFHRVTKMEKMNVRFTALSDAYAQPAATQSATDRTIN